MREDASSVGSLKSSQEITLPLLNNASPYVVIASAFRRPGQEMTATFPPPGVGVTAAFECGHCGKLASEAEAVSYLAPGLLPEEMAAVFLASQSKDQRPVVNNHLQKLQQFLET